MGKEVYSGKLASGINFAAGATAESGRRRVDNSIHTDPGHLPRGTDADGERGKLLARTTTEIAVNALPASLMVICAHEDDEQAYAGLMRAAVEAKIPVQVLILTAGDVGECERYFDKPCGPNEAREFGTVRMEESADAARAPGRSAR